MTSIHEYFSTSISRASFQQPRAHLRSASPVWVGMCSPWVPSGTDTTNPVRPAHKEGRGRTCTPPLRSRANL